MLKGTGTLFRVSLTVARASTNFISKNNLLLYLKKGHGNGFFLFRLLLCKVLQVKCMHSAQVSY